MAFYDTPESRQRAISILARTIEGEAANQSYLGQVAVGSVVANRAAANHGRYGSTIEQQAMAPNQFSAWNDANNGGNQGVRRAPSASSIQAATAVVDGTAADPTGGATFYNRADGVGVGKSGKARQRDGTNQNTIGAHTFYNYHDTPKQQAAVRDRFATPEGVTYNPAMAGAQAAVDAATAPTPAPGAWGALGGAIDSVGEGLGNLAGNIGGLFSAPAPQAAPAPAPPPGPTPVNPNQTPYSQEQGDALQSGLEARAGAMRSAMADKMHAAIAAAPPATQQALSAMRQPQAPASTMTPPGVPTLGEPSMMSAPGLAQYSGIPSVQNPDRWGFLDSVQKEPATPASLMHAAIQEAAPTSPIAASLAASIAPPAAPAQETYSGPKPLTQTGRQGISTRIAGMPTMPPAAGMPAAPPSPLLASETVGAPQSFHQATPFQPNDNRFTPAAPQGPMPSPSQLASMGGTVASSLLGPAGAAAAGLAPNIGGLFARPAGAPAPAPRDESPGVRQQQNSTFAGSPEMQQGYQTDSHPGRTLRDSQSGLGTVGDMAWGGAKGALQGSMFGPGGALLGGAYGALTAPSGMAVNNLFGGPQPGQSYGGAAGSNFGQPGFGLNPTTRNHIVSAGYGALPSNQTYGYSPFGGVATMPYGTQGANGSIASAMSGPGPFGGWGSGGTSGGSPTHGTGGLY